MFSQQVSTEEYHDIGIGVLLNIYEEITILCDSTDIVFKNEEVLLEKRIVMVENLENHMKSYIKLYNSTSSRFNIPKSKLNKYYLKPKYALLDFYCIRE